MIKRLNAGIINFIKRIKLRSVGATLLGGFAGLSLNSNILPSALSYGGITDSFSARWALGGYAVYTIMLWCVGGWAAQKIGSRKFGAITLGSVGLASGLLLTGIGISADPMALLVGGGAAMLYGAVGGMIIADALHQPADPEDHNDASLNTDRKTKQQTTGPSRWFRFFK